jgi:hypothetical protein
MGATIIIAILVLLVVLFVLDWRLNRNRPRPWRNTPPSAAELDREQHPHQGRFLPPFMGGGGSGSG